MLEGCVTAIYTGSTVIFALLFVAASLCGRRHALKPIDSLWGLLLAMATVVYCCSMCATLAGGAACDKWMQIA
jgi:hypothetical protein